MRNKGMKHEIKTLKIMVGIYCRGNHVTTGTLCPECAALLDYALRRLDRCPFGDKKPVCSRCAVHCYKPEMRRRVIDVMRYAGPRMAWRHPLTALSHLIKKIFYRPAR